RKGHAEHDDQSYVPPGETDRWASDNDPIDRYMKVLRTEYGVDAETLTAIDERTRVEVDAATDEAERSPAPEPLDALNGVYADPAVAPTLWYRDGAHWPEHHPERAQGWGTYND
ncbi:MAG: thiamine pyrophosphate-dependent enzyme, partial [Gemmatimonadales bacterium]